MVQYLDNPNKKEEDKAKKETYENLSPRDKMKSFVERMKSHYPQFDYEWVGLDEGNVDIIYGDNSIIIEGVSEDGAKKEIGNALMRLQKEIDEITAGEQK